MRKEHFTEGWRKSIFIHPKFKTSLYELGCNFFSSTSWKSKKL